MVKDSLGRMTKPNSKTNQHEMKESSAEKQNARVKEAREVLQILGLPRKQQNLRTALVLLSMLDLRADMPWKNVSRNTLGIAGSIDWMATHYPDVKKGRKDPVRYAVGSRESVRKESVHQLISAGILVANSDNPGRSVNSSNNSYSPTDIALKALCCVGSAAWEEAVANFVAEVGSLRDRWAAARESVRVPVRLLDGSAVTLSSGEHSELIAAVIHDFAGYYVRGGKIVYLGDTGTKWIVKEEDYLADLGIVLDPYGKMPDILIHDTERDWLFCIEAFHSVGQMSPQRVDELRTLFAGSRPGLVLVTAFRDKAKFRAAAMDIAWETDVWIQDNPTHLIHFDGERFLGPYDDAT